MSEQCGARAPAGEGFCVLPRGHDGKHGRGPGDEWSDLDAAAGAEAEAALREPAGAAAEEPVTRWELPPARHETDDPAEESRHWEP